MSLEKNRHILITLYFMEQERTVTSWELSQMTHVSSRTIKGDIAQINQELKKQGEKLSPKKRGILSSGGE